MGSDLETCGRTHNNGLWLAKTDRSSSGVTLFTRFLGAGFRHLWVSGRLLECKTTQPVQFTILPGTIFLLFLLVLFGSH